MKDVGNSAKIKSEVSDGSQVSSSNLQLSGLQQRQIEREDIKLISANLQKLVANMKSIEIENKHLQDEIDTMKRERVKRYAKFNETYSDKISKVTNERDMLKQSIESMEVKINEASSFKTSVGMKIKLLGKEIDDYETQLAEAKKNISAKECEVEKVKTLIDGLEREMRFMKDEIRRYESLNSCLIIENSDLGGRLRKKEKELKNQEANEEQLQSELKKKEKSVAANLTELIERIERDTLSLTEELKKAHTAFCAKTSEVANRHKEEWKKANQVEHDTEVRFVNVTIQNLESNANELKQQNEEYKTHISKLELQRKTTIAQADKAKSELREKLRKKYEEMVTKYSAHIATCQKNETDWEKLKNTVERELTEVQGNSRVKLEELEVNLRRIQRENKQMKQLLSNKEGKLNVLQQRQVDYSEEIASLNQVLDSVDDIAEDTTDFTNGNIFLSPTRTKKRPLSYI